MTPYEDAARARIVSNETRRLHDRICEQRILDAMNRQGAALEWLPWLYFVAGLVAGFFVSWLF